MRGPSSEDIRAINPTMVPGRRLAATQFQGSATVPTELEWLATLRSEKTRCAYCREFSGFTRFAGIRESREIRLVTRAHVIA